METSSSGILKLAYSILSFSPGMVSLPRTLVACPKYSTGILEPSLFFIISHSKSTVSSVVNVDFTFSPTKTFLPSPAPTGIVSACTEMSLLSISKGIRRKVLYLKFLPLL